MIFWAGYKIFYRTKVIPPEQVDLVTGLRDIDEEEQRFLAEQEAKGPRSFWKRLWDDL